MRERLVLIDQPGRFSRRLGEQVPDAEFARAIDLGTPPLVSTWVDAVCWGIAITALVWLCWACFQGGPNL